MSAKTVRNQIRRLKTVAKELLEGGWTPKLGKYFDNTTCVTIACTVCPVGNRYCPRPSIVGLDV